MAEMILIGDPTMRRLDPKLLSKAEKQEAHAKGLQYRCTCRRDIELIYKFDRRLALQPELRNGETAGSHAKDCSFNEQYAKSINSRNPLHMDKESRKLSIRVYDNILKPAYRDKRERGYEPFKKVWNGSESTPSTSRITNAIKVANLEVSYAQANPKRRTGIKNIYDYSQEVYRKLEEVEVIKRNSELYPDGLHVNDNNDDRSAWVSNGFNDYRQRKIPVGREYGFFYDVLSDLEYTTYDTGKPKITSLKGCGYDLEEFINYQKKVYAPVISTTYSKAGELKDKYLRLTEDGLKAALIHYAAEYGTKHLDTENGYFIATGFLYKMPLGNKGMTAWQVDRLYILRVSSHGIYCESSYEAQAYDVIMREAERNPRLHFYKPSRFSPNVYGGEMREDGVITIDGCFKKGIVEVYGRANDESYALRKAIKEKYLESSRERYVHIQWDKTTGESIDDFRENLAWGIEEIRKGGGF